jgi:hypothetical protein
MVTKIKLIFKFKIMTRKNEIKQILKHLLRKTIKHIDDNHYSSDIEEIKGSCEKIVKNSKEIEAYLEELKTL